MRQVLLGLGALLAAGLVATLALREAADQVSGPGSDEATDDVETFAVTHNGRFDPEDPSELGWAEEEQPYDSGPDHYGMTLA